MAAPASQDLLVGGRARRQSWINHSRALRLLDRYGAAELEAAIGEALAPSRTTLLSRRSSKCASSRAPGQ